MKKKPIPITLANAPDTHVEGSSMGNVTWRHWCEAERDRICSHGTPAVIVANRAGTRICVAVLRGGQQ